MRQGTGARRRGHGRQRGLQRRICRLACRLASASAVPALPSHLPYPLKFTCHLHPSTPTPPQPPQRLELLYLRAICHHALGHFRQAVADYDAVFSMKPREGQGRAAAEEVGHWAAASVGRDGAWSRRGVDSEAAGRPLAPACPRRRHCDHPSRSSPLDPHSTPSLLPPGHGLPLPVVLPKGDGAVPGETSKGPWRGRGKPGLRARAGPTRAAGCPRHHPTWRILPPPAPGPLPRPCRRRLLPRHRAQPGVQGAGPRGGRSRATARGDHRRPLKLPPRGSAPPQDASPLPPGPQESWCKKGPITAELAHAYKPQPPLPPAPPPPPPAPTAEQLGPLTAAADVIGGQLQNHHQGFLPNCRQQVGNLLGGTMVGRGRA
jgi:hypothetical protein